MTTWRCTQNGVDTKVWHCFWKLWIFAVYGLIWCYYWLLLYYVLWHTRTALPSCSRCQICRVAFGTANSDVAGVEIWEFRAADYTITRRKPRVAGAKFLPSNCHEPKFAWALENSMSPFSLSKLVKGGRCIRGNQAVGYKPRLQIWSKATVRWGILRNTKLHEHLLAKGGMHPTPCKQSKACTGLGVAAASLSPRTYDLSSVLEE